MIDTQIALPIEMPPVATPIVWQGEQMSVADAKVLVRKLRTAIPRYERWIEEDEDSDSEEAWDRSCYHSEKRAYFQRKIASLVSQLHTLGVKIEGER